MEVVRLLADARNQAILSLLHAEPSYARRIAQLLECSEAEVTRRLRRMQKANLIDSRWEHIGKNVKMYAPAASTVTVSLGAQGVHVALDGKAETAVEPMPLGMPPCPDLAGRKTELAWLHDARPTGMVLGMPGIGKSALLAAYAHDAEPVFWLPFRGGESATWVATRLAMFLAQQGDATFLATVRDTDPSDHGHLLERRLISDEHTLVFDDVQKAEGAIPGILRAVMTHKRSGQLIAASRERWPGLAAIRTLELHGVPDEAVPDIVGPCSPALVARLQERLGGHPLALHLVTAAARRLGVTVEGLLERAPAHDIESYLLEELDRGLSDGERRVLAAACVMAGPFTATDLKAINPRIRASHLHGLQRQCLVGEAAEGAILHDIVRAFFYDRLDDPVPMHIDAAKHAQKQATAGGRVEAMHHWMRAGRTDKVLALISQNLDLHEHDLLHTRHAARYSQILHSFDRQDVADERTWALLCDERGDVDMNDGRLEEALGHYDEADAYFRSHKEGWEDEDLAWKRATILYRMDRRDEAAAIVEHALHEANVSGRPKQRLERLQATLRAATPLASAEVPPAS